jgi:hypothetical protein
MGGLGSDVLLRCARKRMEFRGRKLLLLGSKVRSLIHAMFYPSRFGAVIDEMYFESLLQQALGGELSTSL